MPKIIMTKGLPGSGKSTWAKEYQAKDPNTVRVNKDDLRAMLHNSVHSSGREGFVLKVRDGIVMKAIAEGHNVIVDDTNFNPIHQTSLENLARVLGAEFEIKDFSDVALDDCIKRDQKRQNYVGEKVIKQMYNQYLKPKPHTVGNLIIQNAPWAIICDLDGTLALFPGKNPYDRDFENDFINGIVKDILSKYPDPTKIVLVSGRDEKFRKVTEDWLHKHGVKYNYLWMRKEGDNRKDSIIKQEIYEAKIKNQLNVLFVLDDRNQVVEFWRTLGFTVFQVADGDF